MKLTNVLLNKYQKQMQLASASVRQRLRKKLDLQIAELEGDCMQATSELLRCETREGAIEILDNFENRMKRY